MTAREFARYGIDPTGYEATMPLKTSGSDTVYWQPTAEDSKDTSPDFLAEIAAERLRLRIKTPNRHDRFYCFARRLWRHHWSFNDIENELKLVAVGDRSLQKKVPEAMVSLRKLAKRQRP